MFKATLYIAANLAFGMIGGITFIYLRRNRWMNSKSHLWLMYIACMIALFAIAAFIGENRKTSETLKFGGAAILAGSFIFSIYFGLKWPKKVSDNP